MKKVKSYYLVVYEYPKKILFIYNKVLKKQ